MAFRLVPVARLPRGQWAPLVALLVWGALVLLAVVVSRRSGEAIALCQFKRLTGVPCPGCGSTRSVLRASQGDLLGSFLANPLLFATLLVLTVVLGLRFVAGRRMEWGLTPTQHKAVWILLAVLVVLNWAYVIAFVG